MFVRLFALPLPPPTPLNSQPRTDAPSAGGDRAGLDGGPSISSSDSSPFSENCAADSTSVPTAPADSPPGTLDNFEGECQYHLQSSVARIGMDGTGAWRVFGHHAERYALVLAGENVLDVALARAQQHRLVAPALPVP